MIALFQYLEKNNVFPDTLGEVFNWDHKRLVSFTRECFIKIDHESEISDTPFVFTANAELSGGTFPCRHLPCRLGNIRELSTFAILYADKILIENPFDDYVRNPYFNQNMRYKLANDLYIIYDIKNLLLNGYISFINPYFHMCKNCYEQYEKKSEELDKILEDLHEYTRDYLLKESTFSVKSLDDGRIAAEFYGPKDIFKHGDEGSYLTFNDAPTILKKKLLNSESADLTDQEVIDSGLVDHQTSLLLNDIVTQHWQNQVYNSSYLTNRIYDFDLLRLLDEKYDKSSNIFDSLTHSIPFVKGIDHLELMKLRHNETDSFEVYRDKITEIFREGNTYSDSEAKDIYNDYLRPELNRMNKALSDNQKIIKSKLTNKFFIYSSFITIGISSGFITPELGAIIASLGGIQAAEEAFNKFQDLDEDKSDIRKNDLYFLWKVQELSN